MQKIIHYSPRFYPLLGGVETHVDTIIKNMLEYQFEVLAGGLPNQPILERYSKNAVVRRFNPINILQCPPKMKIPWKLKLLYSAWGDYIRTCKERYYLKKSSFDLLHIHEVDVWNLLRLDLLLRTNIFTKLAKKLCDNSFVDKPVLLTKHSWFTPIVAHEKFIKFENDFTKNFNNIICVDKHIFSNVNEIASDNDKNIWYIPNSVDTEKFSFTPITEKDELCVGFVGRLDPVRGIDLLYQLIKHLPSDIKLHLILSGDMESIMAFKSKLRYITKNNNICIYSNISYTHIPTLLQKIDILFNPVLIGGISRITLESMSCGRPVIMIDDGDRYPLINNKTGYLINNEISDLLNLLNNLKADKDVLKILGRNARNIIELEFSDKIIIPKIKRLYDSLIHEWGY